MSCERWFGICAIVLAVGCGGNDGGGGGDDTSIADAAVAPTPDASPPLGDNELQLTIGPLTVPPGDEDTVCVVLDLGNTAPAMIREIRTNLTPGTHHVIVTREDDGAPIEQPFSCGAFAGGGPGANLLFIAQQPQAKLTYPAGTGLRATAHQLIHLEMHYFNYLDDPDHEISATITFELAEDDGTELAPVELLFTGSTSLHIPAQSQVSTESFHSVPAGAKIFALSSHTHQYGTYSAIYRATSEGDPEAVLLHESTNWAEPPLDEYEPFSLGAGEGLLLTCDYFNTSDQDVSFGLGFNDEMCFLWAHYFVE